MPHTQQMSFSSWLARLRRIGSWFIIALLWLIAYLPLPLLALLGQLFGRLFYFISQQRRHIALVNIRLCLPEYTRTMQWRIAWQHFGYLGQAAFCQGISWHSSRRRLQRIVRIENQDIITNYLTAKQPVIVLVPHFVGLELGGTAFTALIHPGMYMYQQLRDPLIDAQVKRGRTRFGSIPIERRASLRPIVRAMQQGIPLFYLPDQDAGKRRGIFAPFCGIPAATVPTLGKLAQFTHAHVIPTYCQFLPWGRGLVLHFGDPLINFPSGDVQRDTAAMNQLIERAIRIMPAQYFWVHRRFKTRPAGTHAVYTD